MTTFHAKFAGLAIAAALATTAATLLAAGAPVYTAQNSLAAPIAPPTR